MRVSVEMLFERLARLEWEKTGIEEKLTALTIRIAEENKALVAELEKGATTGDRLTDLIIRFLNKQADEETLAKFRAFEQNLKGRTGELVLVKYPVRVRTRYGGEIRSADFSTETHFRIGKLVGEEFQLIRSRLSDALLLTLPVEQYVQGPWPKSFLYKPVVSKVVKGDLFEWKPGDELSQFHDFVLLKEERYGYDLLVGDAAVRTELKRVDADDFFSQAAEKLGRLILEPTTE